MKRFLQVLVCGAMLCARIAFCADAEFEGLRPDEPGKWNVTAECQMIVLPQKVMLPLLPELLDEAKIEGAFAKLQELIASGTAQLAANLVLKSRDGERAVAETIEELRYGTEFDPPQLPSNAPDDPSVLKHWPVAGITPTSFQTRNVGATLEMEVVAREDGLLRVSVVPQHVRFLRWAKTDAGRLAMANGWRWSSRSSTR